MMFLPFFKDGLIIVEQAPGFSIIKVGSILIRKVYEKSLRIMILQAYKNNYSICRVDWIRTSGLFVPNEARYRAALHPEIQQKGTANMCDFFLT